MAQRRMFSLKIVDTDAFLEMPQSSQLLYFHLAMRADDDGFIANPRRIMRMLGSSDDDYKVLLAKRFLLNFESGVCVIKHWLIHNLVRGDRYTGTQYIKEKQMLMVDDKTKKYSLVDKGLNDGNTNDIPNGNQMAPQVRLGKVRKGKNILAPQSDADKEAGRVINELLEGFKTVNPSYSRLYAMKTQRDALGRLIKQHGVEKIKNIIGYLPKSNANKFAPKITTPYVLEAKLGDLIAWANAQKADNRKVADLSN